MAEQYIYSRAEREFTNALNQTVPVGFGFMSLSPGMKNSLKNAVRNHCQDCPQPVQTDSQGVPLQLLRKVCLPKGQTLLQKSAWIVEESRNFPVSHGYVLEDGEMKEFGPAKWFDALFLLGNPNAEAEAVSLASRFELTNREAFHAKSLKETMDILELRQSCFCQILLACFDALASRRQVLIAWDFKRSGEKELRRSFLYWLYTCLPYDLWSGLGFDSIYTKMSPPGQIHLSFVDKLQIQNGIQAPCIQVGDQPRSLGGNFLVQDGTIYHNDSKRSTDWFGKNGVYARWLNQIVNTLWECPAEKLPSVIQALAEFHQNFQKLLDTREEKLNPQWYDAVCIRSLSSAPQALSGTCERVKDSITESERYDFRLAFMSSFTKEEQEEILRDILERREKSSAPAGEKDIKMLCEMFEYGQNTPAMGLISAFMAQETDTPGTRLTAVMNRYQEMMPPKLYPMLLERIFFSELNKNDVLIWSNCGVDSSGRAAKQRRDTWLAENIPANEPVWELPASISRALAELKGLNDQQQAEFWQEDFQDRCQAVSDRDLKLFADERIAQRLRTLEYDLSSLPGGIPKDALDMLQQKAYEQLLSAPAPFMNNQWLNEVSRGRKTGGEVGETLEILSVFTNSGRADTGSWKRCCKGKSKAAQIRAFAALPQVFCNGSLPRIQTEFIVSFLYLNRKDSQKILLQAASQGGGELLLDLLGCMRKYPWMYPDRLGPNETILLTITQIISRDPEIADKLKERGGGRTPFYEDMKKFLQEPETEEVLSPNDISDAIDNVQYISPAGNRVRDW